MKNKEKQLFKKLCNFKSKRFDQDLLKFATPAVLGHLFFNRMQAIAYGVMKKHGLLGKVNREFRNSLKCAYEQNMEKNYSYYICLQYLKNILAECTCKYAMLKGAVLCHTYPDGYRTSNDIDLLVLPANVTELGRVLTKAGFQQGHIRNMEFVSATRKEIVESKMMRGETIPYIKEMGLPYMRYLEVDINFSLDYKNTDTHVLEDILSRVVERKINDIYIPTLEKSDFFIHLCAHLYKEATTLPWIEMQRDMTLYKYCDLYMLLEEMPSSEILAMFNRAKELNMEKICSFGILQMAAFFDLSSQTAIFMAEDCLKKDPDFLHTVVSPRDKKTFRFKEKDIFKRFFTNNRGKMVEEVM